MEPSKQHAARNLENHTWDQIDTPFQACDFCITIFWEKLSSNMHCQAVGKQSTKQVQGTPTYPWIAMRENTQLDQVHVTHAKIPLYILRKSYAMKIRKTNFITHNDHTSLHRWWFEWLYCRKEKSNIFTEASNNLSWTQSTSTQHWDCWFAGRSTTQSLMFAQSEGSMEPLNDAPPLLVQIQD